jgi:hypothetical protein
VVYPSPFIFSSLFSLFDQRVFHHSSAINSFRTLSKRCRVYRVRFHRFLKFYFNFSNESPRIIRQSPNFSSFPFTQLQTLSFSVSRNSCICHSYENTGVVHQLLPFWNSSRPARRTPRDRDRESQPPGLSTFKRSNVPTLFAPLFTLCVPSCTVFPQTTSENGMVMAAYHVLHTGHSRFQHRRSPEITWN